MVIDKKMKKLREWTKGRPLGLITIMAQRAAVGAEACFESTIARVSICWRSFSFSIRSIRGMIPNCPSAKSLFSFSIWSSLCIIPECPSAKSLIWSISPSEMIWNWWMISSLKDCRSFLVRLSFRAFILSSPGLTRPSPRPSPQVGRGGKRRKNWRPQGDLNPCCRRERPMSLTWLDDGDPSKKSFLNAKWKMQSEQWKIPLLTF